MRLPLIAVVKARVHAFPSHVAVVELRDGLWMPAGSWRGDPVSMEGWAVAPPVAS